MVALVAGIALFMLLVAIDILTAPQH